MHSINPHLENMLQRTAQYNDKEACNKVLYSVPQDFVLGPLFFSYT